jgi:hypothetical protein
VRCRIACVHSLNLWSVTSLVLPAPLPRVAPLELASFPVLALISVKQPHLHSFVLDHDISDCCCGSVSPPTIE